MGTENRIAPSCRCIGPFVIGRVAATSVGPKTGFPDPGLHRLPGSPEISNWTGRCVFCCRTVGSIFDSELSAIGLRLRPALTGQKETIRRDL